MVTTNQPTNNVKARDPVGSKNVGRYVLVQLTLFIFHRLQTLLLNDGHHHGCMFKAHVSLISQQPHPVPSPSLVSQAHYYRDQCPVSQLLSDANRVANTALQLGQLRLNPPRLSSKCCKRVERLSDF